MKPDDEKPAILLIDDRGDLLRPLGDQLKAELGREADVGLWEPRAHDRFTGMEALQEQVGETTRLVVTDYVLSEGGQLGLGGPMIVNWCQANAIPVCNFSRVNVEDCPPEASLFQFRMPSAQDQKATTYIAALFRGFVAIEEGLDAVPSLDSHTASSALAAILSKPYLEPSLSLYMTKLAASNPHLARRLKTRSHNNGPPSAAGKRRMLAYLLGHVLGNSVLRFPGPILSSQVLRSYVPASGTDVGDLERLFSRAAYEGPFKDLGPFFWREGIDLILQEADIRPSDGVEEFDQFNRRAVERLLGRELSRHACTRCGGERGGFWCPLTERPVCIQENCSVASDTWLPEGADCCRIEKDFYDEWGPFLKL